MAFDPDAYLAKKEVVSDIAQLEGGFDPDAYLAKKEVVEEPVSDISQTESALRGAGQGITFGLQDEASGALAAGMEMTSDWWNDKEGRDFGEAYEGYRDSMRRQNEQAQQANPLTYGAGEIAGGAAIPGMGAVGGVGTKAAGWAGKKVLGGAKGGAGLVKDTSKGIGELAEAGVNVLGKVSPAAAKVTSIAAPKTLLQSSAAGTGMLVGGVPGALVGKGAAKAAEWTGGKVAQGAGYAAGKVSQGVQKLIKPRPSTLFSTGKSAFGKGIDVAARVGGDVGKMVVGSAIVEPAGSSAIEAFQEKYGAWADELAARGADALTANAFVRSQSDPEFNAMYKAAKEEAANEAE